MFPGHTQEPRYALYDHFTTSANPFWSLQLVGARTWLPCGGPRYKIQATTAYSTCTFEIKRRGIASWKGLQLGSGFHVELRYAPYVVVHAPVIGLDDDFNVSPLLARFLLRNQDIVSRNSPKIEGALESYRRHLRKMSRWKQDVLTYSFLTTVYFRPSDATAIAREVEPTEKDLRVREMILSKEDALASTYERVRAVSRTALATWWYLFWDDFWRQNRGAFPALRIHEADFNPQYPTSLAYRPLARSALERFLDYRGLLASSRSSGCLDSGILNKVYVRMSQIAFQGASRVSFGDLEAAPWALSLILHLDHSNSRWRSCYRVRYFGYQIWSPQNIYTRYRWR